MKNFGSISLILAFLTFLSLNSYGTTNSTILILSLDYTTTVNDKYRFLTSIKYDYEEYPKYLGTQFVTKSLKGVPYKYQIVSSGTSKISLNDGGYLNSYRVSFKQGDFEISEILSNNKHNGFKLKASFSDGKTTNYTMDFYEVFDIPSLLFLLSSSDLKDILNYKIFYGSSITNLYATNVSSLEYEFDETRKTFVRFKKISDKLVIDRFRIEGVTIGIFTNVTVEGKLVDVRVINKNNINKEIKYEK